jgi:catechol 2,3-dioxygenase-like lactoylglutathione lyase family enzyme
MSTGLVNGLSHVCILVADLGRAVAFYRDVLGLEEAFDYRDRGGVLRGLYLHAGRGTFLEIFQREPADDSRRTSFAHFCLEVADMDAFAARLADRGVVLGEISRGADRSLKAWVEDPDGHRIEIHRYPPEARQSRWIA